MPLTVSFFPLRRTTASTGLSAFSPWIILTTSATLLETGLPASSSKMSLAFRPALAAAEPVVTSSITTPCPLGKSSWSTSVGLGSLMRAPRRPSWLLFSPKGLKKPPPPGPGPPNAPNRTPPAGGCLRAISIARFICSRIIFS
jgi:hypothetical protein